MSFQLSLKAHNARCRICQVQHSNNIVTFRNDAETRAMQPNARSTSKRHGENVTSKSPAPLSHSSRRSRLDLASVLRLQRSQNRMVARYGQGSKRSRGHRHCIRHLVGDSRRFRFGFAVAKCRAVSRRPDTRDLWRAVATQCLLYGAGERRRFQIDRLRTNVAADL